MRLVDLAIWYGRNWDVPDLRALNTKFIERFPLDQDRLIPSVYTRDIPDHYESAAFQPAPLTPEQIVDVANVAAPVDPPLPTAIADDNTILVSVRRLLDDYGGVIFTGPPGTSKTWDAHQVAAKLADRNASRVRFIQLHSSYQYEDFVQGYVPTANGRFKLADKHLLEMCRVAREAAPDLCVLVIDELSRSDPGRVFGEALTYIERTLRGQTFKLASGHEASIPPNLIFLATMNPLDRGVDEVDAALERRFGKIAMDPSAAILRQFLDSNGMAPTLIDRVEVFFRAVQRAAAATPAAAIGQTYFRTAASEDDLRRLWDHQLRFVFEKAFRLDPEGFQSIKRSWDGMFAAASQTEPR